MWFLWFTRPFHADRPHSSDSPFDPLALFAPTDQTLPTIPLTHSPYLTRQATPTDSPSPFLPSAIVKINTKSPQNTVSTLLRHLQAVIFAPFRHQFLVISTFHDAAFVNIQNFVRIFNRRKTMRDNKRSSSFQKAV